MESSTTQRDVEASTGVTSNTMLPPHRATKGKASAIGRQEPIHVKPSPSPEHDRRAASKPLTSAMAMPPGDHEPTDADEIGSVICELTRLACASHNDISAAAHRMIELIQTRNGDAAAIRERLVFIGAVEMVNRIRSHGRVILKRPETKPHQFNASVVSSVGKMVLSVLDSWLVGNKRLGDCTGDELKEQSQIEQSLANGHTNNARFYAVLSAKAGSKRIRDALSAKQVEAIRSKIYGK